MQWIKHDTDANMDAKLQEVLLDYGLEGYGLYWYCVELIGAKISLNNVTFAIEHDARIIARNTGSSPQKVGDMMNRFVSLGLFEMTDGKITCFKIAKRLDQSMTSNKAMRALIDQTKKKTINSHDELENNHDGVMTESCLGHDRVMSKPDGVMQEENRIEEKRIDKSKQKSADKSPPPKKFTNDDLQFSQWAWEFLSNSTDGMKKPNLESWAATVRLMREKDNRTHEAMANLWQWVRGDSFWQANVLSMTKFREKYDQLNLQSQRPAKTSQGRPQRPDRTAFINGGLNEITQAKGITYES